MRLWTLYMALPFYIAGFLMLGYSFQYKLNFAVCAVGWVIAEFAILVTVGRRLRGTMGCSKLIYG